MPRTPESIADSTLRLLLAPGIGPATLRKLRAAFGTDDGILSASIRDYITVDGIARKTAEALRRSLDEVDTERERSLLADHDVHLIAAGDSDYPPLLASIQDPPIALWVRGELQAAGHLGIGIVGSRKCTSYGREQAGRFASLLAQCGYTIVSGGALGIDGAAHRGALQSGGRTLAVMGCGLSRCYPPEHGDLFEQIVQSGGVLMSEFPMAVEPLPEHFPRRNRIISGLSVGVLVVEAAQRSGALITARLAAEDHGREVMAVPGRVDSPASAGCLAAIRDGWAALATSPVEVMQQLESAGHLVRGAMDILNRESDSAKQGTTDDSKVDGTQEVIVEVLRDAGASLRVDELARRCGLPMGEVMAALTMLEMRGQLRRDHKGVELRRWRQGP